MIHLANIHKTYFGAGHDFPALTDIHLDVTGGEIFGIIGRSGAGKSTLVRCINLLERPTQGTVHVNGVDFTQLAEGALRQQRHQIGMIFQHFHLLSARTVFENVAFPLEIRRYSRQHIRQKVLPLLELTGLTERQKHYPHQLSGGQKQRVAIARALAGDPTVLLSDEATSSLDPETTLSILALLKDIRRTLKVTILLITHEMEVIKHICDRVAILDHGKIVETATTVELFAQPQTDVGKSLTRSALHIDLPSHIEQKLTPTPGNNRVPVVRLAFIGDQVEQPLLSTAAERFHIKVNILRATLEHIQDTPLGITVCELMGDATATDNALAFLKAAGVLVEGYGYV